ncbi:hypothetical protein BJ165DRAFT_1614663 [Panaeolus papilionaceus]|nr:hypothetical protein BJ165DRAFT_1614663 [Panaeolus papilionaceus]
MSVIPSSVSMLDFTPRVIHQILSHLMSRRTCQWYYDDPIHTSAAMKAISAFRLTCRYTNTVARPLTFHSVSLNCSKSLDRVTQFLSILDEDPTVAPSVRRLRLYREDSMSIIPPDQRQSQLMQKMWKNIELPKIFSHLRHLETFFFERYDLQFSLNGGSEWHDLGEEMKMGIMNLTSMSSITPLKFSHITSLPMHLITSAPNLTHLNVTAIDKFRPIRCVRGPARPRPKLSRTCTAAAQPYYNGGLRLKSLSADFGCGSLYSLHPTVERSLSWQGCNPQHFSAILHRSRHLLKEVSMYINSEYQYQFGEDLVAISDSLPSRLHTYEFLTNLRFLIVWFSPSLIHQLVLFLNTQFISPSPYIINFEIHMIYSYSGETEDEDDEGFIHIVSPGCWKDLEGSIQRSFPNLKSLVFKYPSDNDKCKWLQEFKVFIQSAFTEMRTDTRCLIVSPSS